MDCPPLLSGLVPTSSPDWTKLKTGFPTGRQLGRVLVVCLPHPVSILKPSPARCSGSHAMPPGSQRCDDLTPCRALARSWLWMMWRRRWMPRCIARGTPGGTPCASPVRARRAARSNPNAPMPRPCNPPSPTMPPDILPPPGLLAGLLTGQNLHNFFLLSTLVGHFNFIFVIKDLSTRANVQQSMRAQDSLAS